MWSVPEQVMCALALAGYALGAAVMLSTARRREWKASRPRACPLHQVVRGTREESAPRAARRRAARRSRGRSRSRSARLVTAE